MKVYETKIVPPKPQTTEKVLARTKCDLCGKESKGWNAWSGSTFEVDETEITINIKQKEGMSFPEGGSGTEMEIDICPDCFKNKLVPWLISQGANIEENEWEW